jgi:ABC-type glutathione transport system ATPase component
MTDIMAPQLSTPVLEVVSLRKEFKVRAATGLGKTTIVPVNDVSFEIHRGRTTALVGESGSGKSTLSRLIMRLYTPEAGSIRLLGTPIESLGHRALRPHRHRLQMVYQNPLLSFDPSQTIGTSIREVMRLAPEQPADSEHAVGELLTAVGLSPAFAALRPRGVSGGELQRAAIARAISAYPDLLVLDEPTSALDVSIQGQVLSLLRTLQAERGMAYLMATHDLKVVRLTSHEVIVLYRGRIVEKAPTAELFADPLHPYTISLLAAEDGDPAAATRAERTSWLDDGENTTLDEVSPSHWVRRTASEEK